MSQVVKLAASSSQEGHEESNGEQFGLVDLKATNLSLPAETLLRAAVSLKDQVRTLSLLIYMSTLAQLPDKTERVMEFCNCLRWCNCRGKEYGNWVRA